MIKTLQSLHQLFVKSQDDEDIASLSFDIIIIQAANLFAYKKSYTVVVNRYSILYNIKIKLCVVIFYVIVSPKRVSLLGQMCV